jgi:hypothetical protein
MKELWSEYVVEIDLAEAGPHFLAKYGGAWRVACHPKLNAEALFVV